MQKASNYAEDPNYSEFCDLLKKIIVCPTPPIQLCKNLEELRKGLDEAKLHEFQDTPNPHADWIRMRAFTIKKEADEKKYIFRNTSHDDSSCNSTKEIGTLNKIGVNNTDDLKKQWEQIGFPESIIKFFATYAHQGGFLSAPSILLNCLYLKTKYSREEELVFQTGYQLEYKFEMGEDKVICSIIHTLTSIRGIPSQLEIILEKPIETRMSIEILTGKEISDENRLVNPKVEYLGPKKEAVLTKQSSGIDSGLSSEVSSDTESQLDSLQPIEPSQDDTYNLSSLFSQDTASGDQDSGIDSERSSVSGGHSPDDDESIIIDGMVLFHNDFKLLIHDNTTSEDLKEAIDCFKELDNHFSPNNQGENLSQFLEGMKVETMSGLEVATLYYQDWKKDEGESQNFHSYFQKNKDKYQLIITTYHCYHNNKTVSQNNPQSDTDSSYDDVDGRRMSEQDGQVVVATMSDIKQSGGLKKIHDNHQQKIQDLKHLRNNRILILAASTSVLILSSAICVMSALEQAGKISTNFLSVAKGFSAPANIAILGSIALLTIISGLATGYMLNRVSERTEEINKVEGRFSSKVLEGATTSMAR